MEETEGGTMKTCWDSDGSEEHGRPGFRGEIKLVSSLFWEEGPEDIEKKNP